MVSVIMPKGERLSKEQCLTERAWCLESLSLLLQIMGVFDKTGNEGATVVDRRGSNARSNSPPRGHAAVPAVTRPLQTSAQPHRRLLAGDEEPEGHRTLLGRSASALPANPPRARGASRAPQQAYHWSSLVPCPGRGLLTGSGGKVSCMPTLMRFTFWRWGLLCLIHAKMA
jgi:hypothetical protein